MTAFAALLALVLHAALMLAAAPTLAGLLEAGRARLAGRAGPPPRQPWRELARLLRKRPVAADQASFVSAGAPHACFAATACAALLVPSFALGMADALAADLFVILGLLAAARVVASLAALDAGTASGGAEASRSGLLAVLAEPALALVVLSVALAAGGTNLDHAAAALREGGQGARAPLVLAGVATAMVALVAAGRSEVSGELSGRQLALAELAGQLRFLAWLDLLAALFLPFGLAPEGVGPGAWLVGLLAWIAKVALLAGGSLLVEAAVGRAGVFRTVEVLGAAALLALLAAVFLCISQGGA